MSDPLDQNVLDKLEKLKKLKEEVARAKSKAALETNCLWYEDELKTGKPTSIHVVSDISILLKIGASLLQKRKFYLDAVQELSVENPPPFTWLGFTAEAWLNDLKSRVSRIQMFSKQEKLDKLEKSLSHHLSSDKKRELELESLFKELDDL